MDYILVERESADSRVNPGVGFWRLTFYSIDDGTFWEMTIDPTYRNYRRAGWNHVVQDPSPWAVYQDLRRTPRQSRTGFPIVSADSPARVVYRCRDRDQALELMAEDYGQRHPEPKTKFQELFHNEHERTG